ncbi:28S ribosomal protein S21, mitochondrial isoform X2 [Pristis pectinata]|uniref:28S ribosomal protein S21, mitochondrial isoform X2 n=1 Tax=Pristis pectinata TaxID=685728 RepID=UPI00223DE834|nr:28S ribosomal protein S21, mitochondrial isoform X2 [Pristis pectinata]
MADRVGLRGRTGERDGPVRRCSLSAGMAAHCRILTTDGIIEDAKRRRYYEKPCRKRIRENYENCRRIYNSEMARKLAFLMRANRQDPWLGC